MQPLLGRTFRAEDDSPDAAAVLILSYAYWQRALGGDPAIVGRTFEMNDRTHTVVGVLPPCRSSPNENDVYMPPSACPFRSSPQTIENRDARMLSAIGRLRPDATLRARQSDLGRRVARPDAATTRTSTTRAHRLHGPSRSRCTTS